MSLIWRNPKILPVEPALLAGLLLHGKRDVRAMHGRAFPGSSCLPSPESLPIPSSASHPGSCSRQAKPQDTWGSHSPYLTPPSRVQGVLRCWGQIRSQNGLVAGAGSAFTLVLPPCWAPSGFPSPYPGRMVWGIQGCCAVLSTFLQIGITLPSAPQSLEDAVSPFPTYKTGLLLLSSLGAGEGQVGGGAEHSPRCWGCCREGWAVPQLLPEGSASSQLCSCCQVTELMWAIVIIVMGSLAGSF